MVTDIQLLEAAGAGDLQAIQQYILSPDFNSSDRNCVKALYKAIENQHISIVILLINAGVKVQHSFLHVAVKTENRDLIELLLNSGANPNYISKKFPWAVPLHIATDLKNIEIIELLLNKGADINLSDIRGVTALHKTSNVEVAALLLEHGAYINAGFYKNKKTPLDYAIDNGNAEVTELLLNRGAKIHNINKCLLRSPNIEMARLLIGRGASFVGMETSSEGSPLHKASKDGDVEFVAFLLEQGINVDFRSGYNQQTALHMAGNTAVVDLLLEHGADVNAVDNHGDSPLHVARELEIVTLLLDKGAEVDSLGGNNESLLRSAVVARDQDLVLLLLNRGADLGPHIDSPRTLSLYNKAIKDGNYELVNALMDSGVKTHISQSEYRCYRSDNDIEFAFYPPLLIAIESGLIGMVELLLDRGAGVNSLYKNEDRYSSNTSPLYASVEAGHVEIIDLLLQRGADISFRDNNGLTLLHIAPNIQVAALLVERGLDVNVIDGIKEMTPLHIASQKGNLELMGFFLDQGADVNASCNRHVSMLHTTRNIEVAALLISRGAYVDREYFRKNTNMVKEAVERNNLNVARLFFEHGADPNAKYTYEDISDNRCEQNLLHIAVKQKKPQMVELLLDVGANVNAIARGRRFWHTPLHIAVIESEVEIANVLLNRGADVNLTDQWCYANPALYEAIQRSSTLMTELLLGWGANVHAVTGGFNRYKWPMIHAVKDAAIASILLDHGADVNSIPVVEITGRLKRYESRRDIFESRLLWTPLHRAITKKNIELATVLLDRGARVNVVGKEGKTLLYEAIAQRDPSIITLLLSHGADPNLGSTLQAVFSIFARREKGNLLSYILIELINNGANTNIQNSQGESFLHKAVSAGDIDLVNVLLSAGVNTNIADTRGQTPLYVTDVPEIARLLLDHGADVNWRDKQQNTPLHVARSAGIVSLLLERGAEVNANNAQHCTPLNMVRQDAETVLLLLDHGADVRTIDKEGNTPLHKVHDAEVTTILIDRGADVNARNEEQLAPLHTIHNLHSFNRCYNVEVASILLDRGAEVDSLGANSKTLLQTLLRGQVHRAGEERELKNRLNLITLLLKHGAYVDITEVQEGGGSHL